MTTKVEIDKAIQRSIDYNEIVTVQHDEDAAMYLALEMEDWSESHKGHEYWGCKDGKNWRVHTRF